MSCNCNVCSGTVEFNDEYQEVCEYCYKVMENCTCEHCENCSEVIYDCECFRCEYCDALALDCECEVCITCGQNLECGNCDCEQEE